MLFDVWVHKQAPNDTEVKPHGAGIHGFDAEDRVLAVSLEARDAHEARQLWLRREGISPCDLEIHDAARYGNASKLRQLLQAGDDFNSLGDGYNFPIYYAVENGHDDCLRLLLDAGAKPIHCRGPKGRSQMFPDCLMAHVKTKAACIALWEAGAKLDGEALSQAGTHNAVELLGSSRAKKALRADASLGHTALWHAVHEDHLDCVQLLLDLGIHPTDPYRSKDDGRGNHHPLIARSAKMCQLLFDHGAPVREPLLHVAAEASRPDALAWMLDHGLKVNARSKSHGNATPFICAACCGKVDNARLLMERGAEALAVNGEGFDALHMALSHCDDHEEPVQMAAFLLPLRFDVNRRVRGGPNPLDQALARSGKLQGVDVQATLVEMLLDAGARLDRHHRATQHVLASRYFRPAMRELLVRRGALV